MSIVRWNLAFRGKLVILAVLLISSSQVKAPPLRSNFNLVRTDEKMRFYVVDTHDGTAKSSIRIYDATSGKLLSELPADYAPEITVSPDGRLLFVCDTQENSQWPQSEIRAYDTRNFQLLQRSPPLASRALYTLRPIATRMPISTDGHFVYVLQMEHENGEWVYSYAIYDAQKNEFLPHQLRAPERVATALILPGRPDLLFALVGAEMQAIAWVDPVKQSSFETVFTFDHHFERGLEFMIAEVGIAPEGKLAYVITRNGHLRLVDFETDKIMPELKLRLPEGSAIPFGDLIVTRDYLLVPTASKGVVSVGGAESISVFDRANLKRLRSIDLSPPGAHWVLSPDGSKIYVSNYSDGSITTYDFASGKALAKVEHSAVKLVWFTIGAEPD